MHGKSILRFLLVLVLLGGGGYAWWWQQHVAGEQDPNRLELYGNVDIREVDLTFNDSEHVEEILVQEGDRVRKGQRLATLHRERMQAQVAAAEASVAAQTSVVRRLVAGTRPQEIEQAKAKVVAAKANLADAKLVFERTRQLQSQNVSSQQQLDDAKARLDVTTADLQVAEQALALAIAGPRKEDIQEAKALLEVDKAKRDLAREILEDTVLVSPADGIIRNRILEPGDMATPQRPVLTLALTDPVWIRTYAPETVLGRLEPGMIAEITTDSYPGKTYKGWIGFLSPTAEFTPKNLETPELRTRLVYQVRVYVCNANGELRLGMPATVALALDQPKPEPGQQTPSCPDLEDVAAGSGDAAPGFADVGPDGSHGN